MTNDEIQALRRIPAILGKASTPEERRTIALRIEALVTGQDNAPLAYSLRHLAALFFPSDEVRARGTFQRLNAAFDTGELVTRIPREHRHVMLSDVAAWPNCPPMAADSPLRYWVPDAPEDAPQLAAPEPTATDFAMLASREQLIAAFGTFTGMNADWFRNLKDTPALLAARRITGQGGRGHLAEPYFCPFAVMQWLVDRKRKKGRPLSERKGWELLERHFPKVYASRSIGDPREAD